MKILHLTVKKKWFDLIASGEKTVEYREIKPYWVKRLLDSEIKPKHFDIVRFRNGYAANAREMDVEFKGLIYSMDKVEGVASAAGFVFAIKLGKIIEKS